MDRQYCLYCGLCVEACPKGCLYMTHEFETAVYRPADLPQDLLADGNMDAELSTYGHKPLPPKPQTAPKPPMEAVADDAKGGND